MLEHGGNNAAIAERYNIELADCLDISTGINPNGWPVPDYFPHSIWSALPQDSDGLNVAAQHYYQSESILAASGSQAAIQLLPRLRAHSRVGILSPSYAEHSYNWQQAGHDVIELEITAITESLNSLDVLIIVNPNNPTGELVSPSQLLAWHDELSKKGGWLIIDEAFIDITPEYSLANHSPKSGLIILRSIGKFFGLAGLRVGFVLAEQTLLLQLAEQLGPWPIAHPSRYIAEHALRDDFWQQLNRMRLNNQGKRLKDLLSNVGLNPIGDCSLFQWCQFEKAESYHQLLAQQGILARLFTSPISLRFGLAKTEQDWQRLHTALTDIKQNHPL